VADGGATGTGPSGTVRTAVFGVGWSDGKSIGSSEKGLNVNAICRSQKNRTQGLTDCPPIACSCHALCVKNTPRLIIVDASQIN
jgi:hypothetical protein